MVGNRALPLALELVWCAGITLVMSVVVGGEMRVPAGIGVTPLPAVRRLLKLMLLLLRLLLEGGGGGGGRVGAEVGQEFLP